MCNVFVLLLRCLDPPHCPQIIKATRQRNQMCIKTQQCVLHHIKTYHSSMPFFLSQIGFREQLRVAKSEYGLKPDWAYLWEKDRTVRTHSSGEQLKNEHQVVIAISLTKRSSPIMGVKYREILVVIAKPSFLTLTELRRKQKIGWEIEALELRP